jgi:2-methylisocitrate lyase-like PEP mutase family enzyme
VSTLDEVKRLVDGIQGHVSIAAGMSYNIRLLNIGQLRTLGVARVSLPTFIVFSNIQAIKKTLSIIHDNNSFEEIIKDDLLCLPEDLPQVLSR